MFKQKALIFSYITASPMELQIWFNLKKINILKILLNSFETQIFLLFYLLITSHLMPRSLLIHFNLIIIN